MKKVTLLILLLTLSCALRAQSETPSLERDSLNTNMLLSPEVVKLKNGFLLDLSLMHRPAPTLPSFKLEIPDASKDYGRIFRLDPAVTYSLETPQFGWDTYGFFGSTPTTLQAGSFRLKNGMRLNTYGQYNKEGWRVPDPSALPWQRDNCLSKTCRCGAPSPEWLPRTSPRTSSPRRVWRQGRLHRQAAGC